MKSHFTSPTLRLAAACALLTLTAAQAQQPAAPPAAATPAPAPAATPEPPAPPDPKLIKALDQLLVFKFSREPGDLFKTLELSGKADLSTLPVNERVIASFRLGDWAKIRAELAAMPGDYGRKVYDKMLADLTESKKVNIRLDDAVAIIDLAPGDFTNDEVHRLGQLLGLTVPITESYWLADRLAKGTEKVGGKDPAKRLLAGRMLLAGGFKDLARTYLPTLEEAQAIADEPVRTEVTNFLTTQQESDTVRRGQVQRTWDENVRTLTDPNAKVNDWEKLKAAQSIAKVIAQVPPSTLGPGFTELAKSNPAGAARILASVGQKVASERYVDVPTRTDMLRAQATLANLFAEQVDATSTTWSQLFNSLAESWVTDAETTFTQKTAPSGNVKFIAPEDILASAPSGKWAAALSPGLRNSVDAAMSRNILVGTNFEQAADRIVEIGKRSPAAGVALAEDFLSVWAKTHNPQLPEPLRKKYDLPEDAHIPVTPIMMEKNIESLARMMAIFRAAGIAPHDYEKVVNAFDLAYSSAEAYRTGHIEQVFGPLDQMDETLFFLILSKMNANLGERWRKMDVQRAGLTRRDETQTLDMVRDGYTNALQMIERWLAGHPSGWRGLTLAGTLLTDWGDFEYFQDLVGSDTRKKMAGYKEKNLQAQEYFQRGAKAYAAEVPKLAPADYSIDAYLSWFNALLGIGSNGQLNLSKAMNRAALARIRESILALPDKAAKAHMSLFSKTVNARLNDDKDPLHEDLKYRYLASSLLITKDDPFSLGAEKKVAYFDELLKEIRLQTSLDGPNTIGREQDFGILVSIIHTEAMGRVAKFGQYLTNDLTTVAAKTRKKGGGPPARKMREAQGPRDEFELSLTEALSPYFDIKSITFASPDVKPHPTAQSGWEETPLAYVLVRAKDASVDRIPPVGMELKFIDLTGPVTIPAESAETVIKITSDPAPPRPAENVELTETLDTRQLLINGALPLEIKATARGLVPELEHLIDLDALKKSIAVKNVNAHDGLADQGAEHVGHQRGRPQFRAALDHRARQRPDPPRGRADRVSFSRAESRRRDHGLPELPRHEPRHASGAAGAHRPDERHRQTGHELLLGRARHLADHARRGARRRRVRLLRDEKAPRRNRRRANRARPLPYAARSRRLLRHRPPAPPPQQPAHPPPGAATRRVAAGPPTRAASVLRRASRRDVRAGFARGGGEMAEVCDVMKKDRTSSMEVQGVVVSLREHEGQDYISLTDIARYRSASEPFAIINNWMRNRSTIEFLGLWEKLSNTTFKAVEFERFKNEAGSNYFVLSPQRWIETTNAIGISSKSGRYGGTFAHSDIAFEFASWISVEFKLYLIKEFERLKADESRRLSLAWNLNRTPSKLNYRIHTDAVKLHLIPEEVTAAQAGFTYASEADLLNVALFGRTAKQWRDANPKLDGNMRDHATVEQLLVLANIEAMNAEFIHMGLPQRDRLKRLNAIAIRQMTVLAAPARKALL